MEDEPGGGCWASLSPRSYGGGAQPLVAALVAAPHPNPLPAKKRGEGICAAPKRRGEGVQPSAQSPRRLRNRRHFSSSATHELVGRMRLRDIPGPAHDRRYPAVLEQPGLRRIRHGEGVILLGELQGERDVPDLVSAAKAGTWLVMVILPLRARRAASREGMSPRRSASAVERLCRARKRTHSKPNRQDGGTMLEAMPPAISVTCRVG